jgi:hypothetical protein
MRLMRWTCVVLLVSAAVVSAGQRAKTLTAEKAGWYSATTRYPHFDDDTPVARLANKVVSGWATRRQEDFVKESTKELEKQGKPGADHTYTVDYEVTCADPARLISMRFDTFRETGGAHGVAEYFTYTFGLIKGKAYQFTLRNFFKTESAYKDTVTAAILAKLMRNPQATLVVNGEVTSLTEDQLNRFSVEKDGLTFFFNPSEVGPYSSGRFQVKLTVEDLGADFRRDRLAPK